LHADARGPPGVRERRADGGEFARPAHRVAKPVDPVALHEAHCAGVVIWPDRLLAVLLLGASQALCDLVERVLPGNRLEGGETDALLADPAERLGEALRMMLTLGVAP